jgi:hypothetical protein
MMVRMDLLSLITSEDPAIRNQALDRWTADRPIDWMLGQCESLDAFRRRCPNLYQRVRAIFFLAAMHRYHLPQRVPAVSAGLIPFAGYEHLLQRRFHEAIDYFLRAQRQDGPSVAASSALAQAYRGLGFQTLADQVRSSVRSVRGNQWMFRIGHPHDHPLRLRPELLHRADRQLPYPVIGERTPVRMDFSHSAWSDIFFLGMDYPEGARVMNVSIDLGVHGRDAAPRPPVETYLRVIDQPVLRLVSVDLNAHADITTIEEVFDFARDYLGLLKAAVIASGVVPPGMEGCGQSIGELFERLVGPGLGLEIVSNVNDIPKGSRLAVSTNLLGSLISICMRATGQVLALTGELQESDRRIVAARAILGEWLGGSGGGWQDSGGVWPGIKLITGVLADESDPEFGISRGRLLPQHKILGEQDVSASTRESLQQSLVLVHGGMAQNVGPILEMVTEKYLLRGESEWQARQNAIRVLDDVAKGLRQGDLRAIGGATTQNFFGPLQAIIPWCTNLYTESLIEQTRQRYGQQFWGFWMLGGMAGGGMGFIFDPAVKAEAQDWLQPTMSHTKRRLETALPFAMEPVTYDFAINDRGTWAWMLHGDQAALPPRYYALMVPGWLRSDVRLLSPLTRVELERFGSLCREPAAAQSGLFGLLMDRMLPQGRIHGTEGPTLGDLLADCGFDREQHEQIREDLRAGRIGLAQNQLPANALIEDVGANDVVETRNGIASKYIDLGKQALSDGTAAVVTLAAGIGSRWTAGAGVVKALHPFYKFQGQHRSFLEVHLAKSRRAGRLCDNAPPHIISTSYLTHRALQAQLEQWQDSGYRGPLLLSPGRSVGLRMIPMVRDLRFAWEVLPQQMLDEQQQKVRISLRTALLQWAEKMGEGNDYTDNVPQQCLHPVGHWYEIPNLLRNGVLAQLLRDRPQLNHLMMHNIDTLGADLDPGLLGLHIAGGKCVSFELITRRLEDRGGGLARVDGQLRLIEGLAMPREEDEFRLSYYNSMTTWINIDRLLAAFDLTRDDLANRSTVDQAVRALSRRIPTYSTLKDVKKRWGHGQEDIYPVAQFEKLWGDITSLSEVGTEFFVVSLARGQQLKDPSQLDGWSRDGSAAYVAERCDWE